MSFAETATEPPSLTNESLFTLYQPYLGNISAYHPIYFLVGTDPEKSKFQFSFKYRLLNQEASLARRYPSLEGFHFAFTQTSFWDLASDSTPFEDTSYKPELLFVSPGIETGMSNAGSFFIQSGIEHESNGLGADDSRSTNFLYFKPILMSLHKGKRFGLQIAPKMWVYVDNDDTNNQDLPDYRGYFDLELKAGIADSLVIGSNLRWAEKGGSVKFDLTYPLNRLFFRNVDLYLHVQYTNSLAESLLNYEDRTEALRIGVGIVR